MHKLHDVPSTDRIRWMEERCLSGGLGGTSELVLLANELGAVFALETAHGEVALGQPLEVSGEEDIEGETAGCSGDGDELGGGLFADFEPEAGGNFAEEGDERGCAFPGDPLSGEIDGGVSRDLSQAGAGGVIGALESLSTDAFRAQREDLEAGERALGGGEVFALAAGDLSDGMQHEGGGDGQLDGKARQTEEAAYSTGYSGSHGVGAFAADGGGAGLAEVDGDSQTLLERLVDGAADRRLGTAGKQA